MCRSYYQLLTDSMRRQSIRGKFILLHFIFLSNATDLWPTYIKTMSAFRISYRTSSTHSQYSPCRLSWTVCSNYSQIVHENILREIFVRKQNKWDWMKSCSCSWKKKYSLNFWSLAVTLRTAMFKIQISTRRSLCVECFVRISEQTATFALYVINWLVFITVVESIYCAVRTNSL